jgi:hypothetical protein
MAAVAQLTPSQVADTFFAALGSQQWRTAASMLDSASASAFRDRELALLIALRSDTPLGRATSDSGGSIMAVITPATPDPSALRSVADSPLTLFSDVRTVGALAALPTLEFAARYLEVSQRSLRSLHAEETTAAIDHEPRTYRVLGHVIEGDSMAHVLYRTTDDEFTDREPHSVAVLHLRRSGIEWRLLLPSDLARLPYTFWLTRDSFPGTR